MTGRFVAAGSPVLAALLLMASGCGPSVPSEPVVREILAQVDGPPGAPDRRLTLVRYTIAPGTVLDSHVHPGIQMASVLSGTLTYRIVSGTARVERTVDAEGRPASVEELSGPTETELLPGDVVLEVETMVHHGANETTRPVVILAALLTEPAEALSVAPPED